MLLSRLASHAFWLGRYLERVEALSRAVIEHDRMCLDLPQGSRGGYVPLLVLCGYEEDEIPRIQHEPGRRGVLRWLVLEDSAPSTVLSTLSRARDNLRSCRVLLPRETWDTLNPAFIQVEDLGKTPEAREILQALDTVIASCQRISAQLSESMIRDEAYSYIRAGCFIERADMLMRVIQVADELRKDADLQPFSDIRWMGLLHSLSAYQMYRREHRGRADAHSTLSFLLANRRFPRSLFFSLMGAQEALNLLPGSVELVQRCRQLREFPLPKDPSEPRSYTTHICSGLSELSDLVECTYLLAGSNHLTSAQLDSPLGCSIVA